MSYDGWAMTWRGVEHLFNPTYVLLLLEVSKCPTMGYDLEWCGASFLSGSRRKCSLCVFVHAVSLDASGVRQDSGDPQRWRVRLAELLRGRSSTSVSLE